MHKQNVRAVGGLAMIQFERLAPALRGFAEIPKAWIAAGLRNLKGHMHSVIFKTQDPTVTMFVLSH